MDIENDENPVDENCGLTALKLEDHLQIINDSLKSSVQLMQELIGDIQLAVETQKQLNQIVDPFVMAVAHQSIDSSTSLKIA